MKKAFIQTAALKQKFSSLLFTIGIFSAIPVHAQPIEGIYFSHQDWETVCDNTGTCRTAGYSSEDDMYANNGWSPSVLFTRKAGANQPVIGELQVLNWDGETPSGPMTLWIDNKNHGTITSPKEPGTMKLSTAQVQALLDTAKTSKTIAFVSGDHKGTLSNQGMSAALLKMDDFQKRVGTTGALIRKGDKPETDVLKAQPIPVLTVPKTLENDEQLKAYYSNQKKKIIALTKTSFQEECFIEDDEDPRWAFYPLNEQQALISRTCWRGAYNYGDAFWLVDKDLTSVELVSVLADYYERGQMSGSQKDRGVGDCWSSVGYAWDGRKMIQIDSSSTGLCKGAPGGFWVLPTLTYEVKNLNKNTP